MILYLQRGKNGCLRSQSLLNQGNIQINEKAIISEINKILSQSLLNQGNIQILPFITY